MKIFSKHSDKKFFWTILIIIVYAGFKIIGLAPFSHETNSKMPVDNSRKSISRGRVLCFSKIGLVYNILLSILLQVMAALIFPAMNPSNYPNGSPLSETIDLALLIAAFVTINFIIIYVTFRQKNAVCIMNKLLEIHHLIPDVEKDPLSYRKILLFSTVHITFNSSLWITLGITLKFDQPFGILYTIYWLFNIMLAIVVYGFIVQYFMLVGFLARKLEQVNSNLLNLDEVSNYLSHTSSGNTYLSVLSLSTHSSQLKNLQLLCTIRTMLSDVSQDIADFFSFPILLSIGCFFILFVDNVYYLISPLFVPSDDFSLQVIVNSISWIFMNVYPLTMLSANVTKARNEAKLTGRIVHKLLATPMSQGIKTKLKQFSLQLLHENISFTAYGFFALDFTMLHSMLGAAATYLVILIQFQQTDINTSNHTRSVENKSVQ